jgi:hypothetical protein
MRSTVAKKGSVLKCAVKATDDVKMRVKESNAEEQKRLQNSCLKLFHRYNVRVIFLSTVNTQRKNR